MLYIFESFCRDRYSIRDVNRRYVVSLISVSFFLVSGIV